MYNWPKMKSGGSMKREIDNGNKRTHIKALEEYL